ncbi:MAG: penicillin-binding protein activator [Psychromonas sp.]|nr:penicillin-binding protein activator [Psychromonas sp.]
MNALIFMKQNFRFFALSLLALPLTACISMYSNQNAPPQLFSHLEYDSNFYLYKDQLEDKNNHHIEWRMAALQASIQESRFTLAQKLIDTLQKNLNALKITPKVLAKKSELSLLIIDYNYKQGNFKNAKTLIDKIDARYLPDIAFTHYLQISIALQVAYKENQEAVKSLFTLLPRLTDDAIIQKYNDLLLDQLALLPTIDLQATQTTNNKAGWYALALVYQRYKVRPFKLQDAVQAWRIAYPKHSLLKHMPIQVMNFPKFTQYAPKNIAVLLPLTGVLKAAGEAVQYGISHAYYHQLIYKKDEDSSPTLHFIDTNGATDEEILNKLKTLNIDFVIGPLLKNRINSLLPKIKDTPVIILNAFPDPKSNIKINKKTILTAKDNNNKDASDEQQTNDSNHFSLTLSPEEEARQAATIMQFDGYKHILIIAPQNDYGKRVVDAYSKQWDVNHSALPYQAIEAHFFKNKAGFSKFINDAMLTNKSKVRIAQIKSITDLKLESKVRSRRDINAIYIVSKRSELILLKPFINISISPFASQIPLYASSRSHSADITHTQNKELAGLSFSDNNFLLTNNLKISETEKRLLKNDSYAALRLMVLGNDSYQLIYEVKSLKYIKGFSYNGLLGKLTLDKNNNILTKFGWAKYSKDGQLIEINTPTATE